MSLLRLVLGIWCCVMTFSMVTCSENTFRKYVNQPSVQLNGDKISQTESKQLDIQRFTSDKPKALDQHFLYEWMSKRIEYPLEYNFWRYLKTWNLNSLAEREAARYNQISNNGVIGLRRSSKQPGQIHHLAKSDNLGHATSSGKHPLARFALNQRNLPSKRLSHPGVSRNGRLVPATIPSLGFSKRAWRFLAWPQPRDKLPAPPNTRTSFIYARAQGHSSAVKSIPPCGRNSFGIVACSRSVSPRYRRNNWKSRRNERLHGASGGWPSSYLLGGAMGRR